MKDDDQDGDPRLRILAAAGGDAGALALALVDVCFAAEHEAIRAGLRTALEAAAVPHWITPALLASLLPAPERDAAELLARLRRLTILEPFPARGEGACNVHEETRLALIHRLAQTGRLPALAARCADLFDGPAPHERIERAFHLAIARPRDGAARIEALCREWSHEDRVGALHALGAVCAELHELPRLDTATRTVVVETLRRCRRQDVRTEDARSLANEARAADDTPTYPGAAMRRDLVARTAPGSVDEPSRRAHARGDRERPEDRVIQPAVGWLLGPELIANLRSILRRKGRRGDPRTWMAPNRYKAHDEYTAQRDGCLRQVTGDVPLAEHADHVDGDLWFDYVADLGDHTDGTYATAFACQVDLQLDLAPDEALPIVRGDDLPVPRELHVQGTRLFDAGRGNLPRGEFLFVGGDTAYHVADEVTVRDRVARPFNWATQDVTEQRLIGAPGRSLPAGGKTRIYGIPGNHDWYNDLHGFSLLFLGPREPEPDTPEPPVAGRRGGQMAHDEPAITLDGFAPQQQASYVAIQLPYGWQLWGLDIDQGIDARQAAYFRSLLPGSDADDRRDPARLILCTPSPPVVFRAAMPAPEHVEAIEALSLTPAYACAPAGDRPAQECSLPPGTCRLDLSGDTHHYARYRWPGPEPDRAPAPYMGVVSGLGGAFHHPSFTCAGHLKPAAEYPSREASLQAIAPNLLNWRSLVSGSWIHAFPIAFGLILGFGSINAGGAGWVLSRALSTILGPGVARCGDPRHLEGSLLMLGTVVASIVLLVLAVWLFDHAYAQRLALAKDGPPPRRTHRDVISTWARTTYGGCTLAAIGGLAVLLLFHLCPHAPPAVVSLLDLGVTIVLLLGLVGGSVLAWMQGEHLPRPRRLLLGLLGLVHGLAQVATPWIFAHAIRLNRMVPIVWVLFFVWWITVRNPARPRPTLAALIGVGGLVLTLVAHWVLRPSSSTPTVAGLVILATWLLQLPSRRLFRKTAICMVLLNIVWIVAWLGGIAAMVAAAHGAAPVACTVLDNPTPQDHLATLTHLAQFFIGSVMAAPLCLAYFAWYLAIAGLADAHNNEVGGAARVTRFRQIIRFHVHRDGLTGYVISVENKPGTEHVSPARHQGRNLEFRLQDVFTIAPRPGP